jgi:uncharacterized protein YecA (UPF0149 family)
MLDRNKIEKITQLQSILFEYVEHGPLSNRFRSFLQEEIGDELNSQEKYLEVIQAFIYDHKPDQRHTPLEMFLRDNDSLEAGDREILESWKSTIHSIFQNKKVGKDFFNVYNLVNEKHYVIKTLTNFQNYKSIGLNDYIFCRIAPFEDYHILIGNLITFPRRAKKEMLEMAIMVQMENPSDLFKDNPEKLQQIHEYNAIKYHKFYDMFDSDEIFTSGENVDELIATFTEYVELGVLNKSKVVNKIGKPEKLYFDPDFSLEEDETANPASYISGYTELEDVGLAFDEKEGMFLLPFYATFTEIFTNPNFQEIENYKECVLHYLEDDSISAFPFVKAISKNRINSVNVFEDVLEQPGFSIDEDFNKLMETYKYDYVFNNKVSQTVIYDQSKAFKDLLRVYEELAEDLAGFPGDMMEDLPNVGRNDPCPCGSGRKFKKCCLVKIG